MKKLALISVLVLLVFGAAFAESSYGLRAGVNLSSYNGKNASGGTKLGFHGGLMMMYELHPMLTLQPELLYTQRGAKKDSGSVTWSQTQHYAELPILLKLNLSAGDILVQPYAGPEFRYMLSGKRTAKVAGVETTSDIKNMNDFDFGVGLGADIIYNNFLFGARYSIGMSNIYEKSGGSQSDIKNNAIMINLGVLY